MQTSERHAQTEHRSFMRRLMRVIMWVVIAAIVLQAIMIVAFRSHYRPIIDRIRAFNKRILNPAMMKYAGHKDWYAAVIRHTGRRSGKPYATPVLAEPIPDGFLIPLPYGEHVDWLRNILAAGKAEIENKGLSYAVVEPAVVSREEAAPLLPSRRRRQLGLYGVEKYLRVKSQENRRRQRTEQEPRTKDT